MAQGLNRWRKKWWSIDPHCQSVAAPTLPPKFCRRCERKFLPQSIVQLRCRLCIPIYNRERDRRLKAAARLRDVA